MQHVIHPVIIPPENDFFQQIILSLISSGLTALIAWLVAMSESKKAKVEMKERIKSESAERLKVEKRFYVEKIEIEDYDLILRNLVILTTIVSEIPIIMLNQTEEQISVIATFDERRIFMNRVGLIYNPIKERSDLYELDESKELIKLMSSMLKNVGRSGKPTDFYGDSINNIFKAISDTQDSVFAIKQRKFKAMKSGI